MLFGQKSTPADLILCEYEMDNLKLNSMAMAGTPTVWITLRVNLHGHASEEILGNAKWLAGVGSLNAIPKVGATVENVFKQTIDSEVTLSTVLPA